MLHRIIRRAHQISKKTLPVKAWMQSAIANLYSKPSIFYISDGLGWVLDDIGLQIAKHITDYRVKVVSLSHFTGYRNSVLHFAAPPLLLRNEVFKRIHPSNKVILTWTHGLPNNPDANVQEQLDNLLKAKNRIDCIQVTTQTALSYLNKQKIAPNKLKSIPFGIDTVSFSPPTLDKRQHIRHELGIPDWAICIGSFQKDSPGFDNTNTDMKWVKGPDILIATLKALNQKYPIFVLLTAPSRGYVLKHLKENSIPYRHEVLSDPLELVKYYQALDLYIIPSRDEGGPMSVLEAMSTGIPVVSTRVGLPLDLIQDGENGKLVAIEDVDGLVRAASEIIESPQAQVRLKENALKSIQDFSWSIISDQYANELYSYVLSS